MTLPLQSTVLMGGHEREGAIRVVCLGGEREMRTSTGVEEGRDFFPVKLLYANVLCLPNLFPCGLVD
jgi:hypothetical protein